MEVLEKAVFLFKYELMIYFNLSSTHLVTVILLGGKKCGISRTRIDKILTFVELEPRPRESHLTLALIQDQTPIPSP